MQAPRLDDLSLVDVHDRVHDVHDLVVDHDFVLLEVFFFFLSELVLLVLVVTEKLDVEEKVLREVVNARGSKEGRRGQRGSRRGLRVAA